MRVALSLVVLVTIAAAGSLSAQHIRFGIGGGLLVPLSDYRGADKMGVLIGADATIPLSAVLDIRVAGDYSQTSHKSGVAGHTTLDGGLAELVYSFGHQVSPVLPYLQGVVGYMHGTFATTQLGTGTQNKIVFGLGGGVAFRLGTGNTRVFVESRWQRFQSNPSLQMVPIRAGFRF